MSRVRRRSFAVSAALLTVALFVGVSACSGQEAATSTATTGRPPVDTTTTTEVPFENGTIRYSYVPEVGDCFDKRKVTGPGSRPTEVILELACDQPHGFEIFALVDYPAPETMGTDPKIREMPADDVFRRYAQVECPKRYRDYVGNAYELSKFEIGFVLPLPYNWPGLRTIGCSLYATGTTKLATSVRGTGT